MSKKESSNLDAFLSSEKKLGKREKDVQIPITKQIESTIKKKSKKKNSGAIGFEDKLWKSADRLRGNMDASEYKNILLGLIFLKYISDAFEEKFAQLTKEKYANPEDRDEYIAENIFWVPKNARWSKIKSNSKRPEIGVILDDAMIEIEKNNQTLRGILPKDYAKPELDKIRLGEVIDLISDIGLGDKESRTKDILGNVYEYFLSKFALIGGQVFTPSSIVKLLVNIIEPFKGRVYDPCCGSGGMFVQSEKFVEEHGGKIDDISIYGQESNPTTWKLAKMNLAIRGIDPSKIEFGDSFLNNKHPSLKADYILANPPFNLKYWGRKRLKDDIRWKFGVPPEKNANFAWVQHIINHLSSDGTAGFLLAMGSLTSSISDEYEIRRSIINKDLVDCVISLPVQLFLTTSIPACLWFITKNKRERKGSILFIDTRKLGKLMDRTTRIFTEDDISLITNIYHNWRNNHDKNYKDIPSLCKSVSIEEIRKKDFNLSTGMYIEIAEVEFDDTEFNDKMERFSNRLRTLFNDSNALQFKVKSYLKELGYDI